MRVSSHIFGQGRKDAKDEAPVGRRRINLGPLPGQDLQADISVPQVLDKGHQVPQMPPELIELPHNQGVPRAEGFEAGIQPGPGLLAP